MNPDWFRNSPAGTVVEVNDPDVTYWAYVPKPLPTSLAMSPELVKLLAQAADAIGELRGLGRRLLSAKLLVGPLVRREAVDSSRIEGTKTNVVELYAYEAQNVRVYQSRRSRGLHLWPRKRSDAQEVLNYVHALEYGLGLPGDAPIDTALICELHKRLMTGVRGANKMPGCIRTERNWIGGGSVEQAEFVPPPANLVPELMTSFHHYLTADTPLPQLIRIGLLHYEFETIHPFMDGNGRVGRLLISLLLAKWGLLPLPLLHLSSYLERNKREYCDRMLAIRGRGLWEDWLLFFLKGVIEQAARSADKVGRLHDLQRSWQNRLEDQNAPGSQIKLANKLFEMPILSVPMAAALLKLTYPGAKKVVDELVKMGILSEFLSPHFGFPSPLNLFIARDITTIANRQ